MRPTKRSFDFSSAGSSRMFSRSGWGIFSQSHNLRSALDQALAEIVVRISNRSEAKVEFPFGLNFGEFQAALAKQKKLPPDAAALIERLQPYKGGDPLLWLLHSANRKDKHRMGLVPVNLRTEGKCSYLTLRYGQALVLGSRGGQNFICQRRITDAEYLLLALKNASWGAYGLMALDPITGLPVNPLLDQGTRIHFDNLGPGSAEESFEFFTATPGTKTKTDFEPSFDIAFRDVGGLERKPIVHVLSQLRDLVERILLTFERRFFP